MQQKSHLQPPHQALQGHVAAARVPVNRTVGPVPRLPGNDGPGSRFCLPFAVPWQFWILCFFSRCGVTNIPRGAETIPQSAYPKCSPLSTGDWCTQQQHEWCTPMTVLDSMYNPHRRPLVSYYRRERSLCRASFMYLAVVVG